MITQDGDHGVTVENCNIRAHRTSGGGSSDYHLVAHQSNIGLDTESGGFGQADYDSMKSAAATSQAAFDSAAGSVLGSWYTARTSGFKSTIRDIFNAL